MTKKQQAVKTGAGRTLLTTTGSDVRLPSVLAARRVATKKATAGKGGSSIATTARSCAEELDIDDIFKQARTAILPARQEKVCEWKSRSKSCTLTQHDTLYVQTAKAAGKLPRVVGSKDDLFGTGQPKQRR